MIKCYVIPPIQHLDLIKEGDSAFCLAQLYIRDRKYREYFQTLKSEGWWITMDSGIGDHDPVTQDELFDAMKDLLPSEVIPVDTLFDKDQTITNLFDFKNRMECEGLNNEIQIFGVPQGNTFEEWVDCYKILLAIPEVCTIGMSKLSIPWVVSRSINDKNIGRDRNVMYDFLKNSNLIDKPLHFLGAGEPEEFLHYKDDPFVRSTDSCFAVWSAMNSVSFKEGYIRIPTPKDYFKRSMDKPSINLSIDNVNYLKNILS